MELRVSPTRMQLLRLRRRLKTAERGHKLLKDKRDGLMKEFLKLLRRARELRGEVEDRISRAFRDFLMARSSMSPEAVEEALMYPKRTVGVSTSSTSVMGVRVPRFELSIEGSSADEGLGKETGEGREGLEGAARRGDILPYGFVTTSGDLDSSIRVLSETLPQMLELAEVEKSVELMADEIEKTRRRVNALEYVLIPRLTETVKFITMKLDEGERANLARLMKVKDIVRAREV